MSTSFAFAALRIPASIARRGSSLKTVAAPALRFNAISHLPLRASTSLMSCHYRSFSHSQQPRFIHSLPSASSFSTSPSNSSMSVSNTLYVANLPWSVDEPELETLFKDFGEIKRVTIGRDPSGRARGFAHVEFHTSEASEQAMSAHTNEPFLMGPRTLKLDYATAFKPKTESKGPNPPGPTLFIDKFYGKEADLELLLGEHAEGVRKLFFFGDSGSLPARGLVVLGSTSQATAAMRHLEKQISEGDVHQRFFVSYARPRKEDQSSDNSYRSRRR